MWRAKLGVGICIVATGLAWLGDTASRSIANVPGEADEKLLKSAGIATDDNALLQFFRDRSLSDDERKKLGELVQLLDHENYTVREKAQRDIVKRGRLVLPFLKEAVQTGSLEMTRRAKQCIERIETGAGHEQPVAAARLLAVRQPKGAVEVLLTFLPYADDPWVEEEVFNSLSSLSLREGKVDPVLLTALKDPLAERRGAAVYVLARCGSIEHREVVRQFLQDGQAHVQLRAAHGLVGKRTLDSVDENLEADKTILKGATVALDAPSLVKFLRSRSLTEADQRQMRNLIQQLDDRSWTVREDATKRLSACGTPALPFLKEAAETGSLEMARRAKTCLDKIQRGPGPALPIAAARLLAYLSAPASPKEPATIKPAEAIRALLNYIPFADDVSVEEEVLNCLCLLSIREVKVDPQFLAALEDELPARRGAAAYVLGRVGTKEQQTAVHNLLDDPSHAVRLRVALSLVQRKEKPAVARVIDALAHLPSEQLQHAEQLLVRLAGDKAPQVPLGVDPATRQQCHVAWLAWWKEHEKTFDLAKADLATTMLGYTLVVERTLNKIVNGKRIPATFRVVELDHNKKERWKFDVPTFAVDAQVLSQDRVLICEYTGNRVSERDFQGNVKWEKQILGGGNPIAAQRLPNGNTFVVMQNRLVELDRDGREVYTLQRNQFDIFRGRKLRNGEVVYITNQGRVTFHDPKTNRELRSFQTANLAIQFGNFEVLNNGHLILPLYQNNQVIEYDRAGRIVWQANVQNPNAVQRLPNGNTLVSSFNTKRIVEINRNGQEVWSHTAEGNVYTSRRR